MLIALIGLDGAGKTTLAHEVVQELGKIGKCAVYLTPFRYVIFKPILTLIKNLKRNKDITKNPLLIRSKKPFFCELWPLLALFDNWCYYLFRIKPLLIRKRWVICDRYFYDFAISFQYYGYTNKFINKIYLKFLPSPHITFVLDVPANLAMKRAKELNINYYIEQRERYLNLAKEDNLFVMDTTPPINRLKENIMNRILGKNEKVRKF